MRAEKPKPTLRCAVCVRASTEHGLEQEFKLSLTIRRESSEAIQSKLLPARGLERLILNRLDDGGASGVLDGEASAPEGPR